MEPNESLLEEAELPSGEEYAACYRPRSLTLEDAINRLKSVRYLGFQGQAVWNLVQNSRPPIPKYLEDEDFMAGADICFGVAEYLRFWLSDEDLASMEQIYMEKLEKNNWLCLEDGVYYGDLLLTHEGHAFMVVIQGNTITYAGGYGGRGLFSLKSFDKREWQDLFNTAMRNDLDAYAKVFVVDYAEISEVEFINMRLYKSKKYT
jgi:hypothetical protein